MTDGMTDSRTDASPGVRYETEVIQVGSMVEEFRQTGLMILFADLAPAELHDICVLHRPSLVQQAPEPGDVLQIGSDTFTITAIGAVAGTNLLQLGHISLKADGAAQAALPGDISVDARPLPRPEPGQIIRFTTPDGSGSTPETTPRTKEQP